MNFHGAELQQKLKEADGLVLELKQLEQLISEANERAETIKDTLKQFMGDTETLKTGTFTINYATVKSMRFDGALFRTENPEIYKTYCKPTVARRFTVR